MSTPHSTASEGQVVRALQDIRPTGQSDDIVTLGLVKHLKVADGGTVSFAIHATPAVAEQRQALRDAAIAAVRALPGVADVHVTLAAPRAPGTQGFGLPERQRIPGARHVIAVSSGKGGVGKSTVTVNLAVALQRLGHQVGILDGDVYGPNIPLMLGVTGQPTGQGERMHPFVAHGLQVMSMGSLVPDDQPMIWRGPMVNKAVQQFMFQVDWHGLDYLLVDLPPGTGDVQLTLVQSTVVDGAVLVTTPQDVAVLDVSKAIRMFEKVDVPCVGVVENMSWFRPPDSETRYEIFGSGGGARLESEFGVPLLGQIPIGLGVREGGDRGMPHTLAEPDGEIAAAFAGVAGQLLKRLETKAAEANS